MARSYYLEFADPDGASRAVCVVPGSAQPGQSIAVPDLQLDLRISEPVEFPLYVSSTRLTDRPGQLVSVDREQMRALPPLRTVLRTSRRSQRGSMPVQLHAHLSEIGTMELSCRQVGGTGAWRLQFDVRAATETDRVAVASTGEGQGLLDESHWTPCQQVIEDTFGPEATADPESLVKELARATDW